MDSARERRLLDVVEGVAGRKVSKTLSVLKVGAQTGARGIMRSSRSQILVQQRIGRRKRQQSNFGTFPRIRVVDREGRATRQRILRSRGWGKLCVRHYRQILYIVSKRTFTNARHMLLVSNWVSSCRSSRAEIGKFVVCLFSYLNAR